MGGLPGRVNRVGRAVRAGAERHPAAVCLPLAALLSLTLNWRLLRLPMISDEGGYAFAAQRWLDGRGELYDDLWISRPQGIYVAYVAILETLGGTTLDFRLGAWLVGVATMAVVWAFAAAWRGPRLAAGATLAFAVLMGSPATEGFTANAEVFMALPAALAALCLLRAARGGWRWWWLAAAGALAGVATLLKPSGIVMAPVAVAFLGLSVLGTGDPRAALRAVRGTAAVGAGFAAGVAPALLHGYATGWDRFLFGAVTYRLFHQSSATNSVLHHAKALGVMVLHTWPLFAAVAVLLGTRSLLDRRAARAAALEAERRRPPMAGRFVPARGAAPGRGGAAGRLGGAPFGQARLGIVARQPDWRRLGTDDPLRLLLRLWLLGCAAGVAMGGDWWWHYLIQAAAPLAIWLAVALGELRPRLPRRAWSAVAVAVAALLALPYGVLTLPTTAAITDVLYDHPGYVDQQAIADYVNQRTTPETPIFAAFDHAALYYLADRPPAYPYLFDQELRARPGSQAELIAMVESRTRPKYIVATRQLAPFPDRGVAFWDAVLEHYVLEVTVRGVPIFRAKAEPPLPLTPVVT